MNLYELASAVAIAMTIGAYIPYVRAIRAGGVRPHFFSWLIWSLTTSIVFLAQVSAAGGAGAWPTGVSAAITFYVAWLAWVLRSDISVTRSDRWFLAGSLASLPAWFLTADPFWSVLILTVVDGLGFGPTLRKAYANPWQESQLFYALFAIRSLLSIVALETRNATTVLFPAVMVAACILAVILLAWRRRHVPR